MTDVELQGIAGTIGHGRYSEYTFLAASRVLAEVTLGRLAPTDKMRTDLVVARAVAPEVFDLLHHLDFVQAILKDRATAIRAIWG
jgi:hypothetical protein